MSGLQHQIFIKLTAFQKQAKADKNKAICF